MLVACQPDSQTNESSTPESETTAIETNHPEALQKILDAHGGLDQWRSMESLYFEIVAEAENEKHFVQLGDRRARVEGSNVTMGFDGVDVWMEADTAYKRDPKFYYNLMFYFYAMPFVLADPGISYDPAPSFQFDGVEYQGLAISYDDGVGNSPKDQYFIYYNPENHQMAWLGYTVTYFSGESSEDVKWIRYHDWNEINGIMLPEIITWYQSADGIPTEGSENQATFTKVKIEKEPYPDTLFEKPSA